VAGERLHACALTNDGVKGDVEHERGGANSEAMNKAGSRDGGRLVGRKLPGCEREGKLGRIDPANQAGKPTTKAPGRLAAHRGHGGDGKTVGEDCEQHAALGFGEVRGQSGEAFAAFGNERQAGMAMAVGRD